MSKVTHDDLWQVCVKMPADYEPYGSNERTAGDCSCGCRWFLELAGRFRYDWGVCVNPKSHRCGTLTFEHQGCVLFSEEG